MVAYSFKRYFSPQIATGLKTHTIRADRKRHARPGEDLQLFEGMRTRHCRKIIPDPVCTFANTIAIMLDDDGIFSIEIHGKWIGTDRDAIEYFARRDGFAPEHINGIAIDMHGKTATENMNRFWLDNYGSCVFSGVIISWGEPL